MMANKIKLKKFLLCVLIISMVLLGIYAALNIYEYHIYRKDINNKLSEIINAVVEKYPDVTKQDIGEIINDKSNKDSISKNDSNNDDINKDNASENKVDKKNIDTQVLKDIGIDIDNESVILENDNKHDRFLIINICFLFLSIVIIVCIFLIYNRKKDKEIAEITRYIEEINKKNYTIDIDEMSEDELSILKNEVYKTTIMLKEIADNSNKDKLQLKQSLEDISHQLKTPLTSILVMLDNLIDDEEMDKEIRQDFIRDIKRDVVNINFLVQAILKLSKFDSNTINFIKEERLIKDIVGESIKNVSALCDLRNIKIEKNGDEKATIHCDFRWQVEAITNILKNCIEHSKDNEKIIIKYEKNNVYSLISIRDFGDGIAKEDLPHIFERFYKGKNSSSDSVGIGLALAKTIIEEDKGNIYVDSDEKGTIFAVKYFYI